MSLMWLNEAKVVVRMKCDYTCHPAAVSRGNPIGILPEQIALISYSSDGYTKIIMLNGTHINLCEHILEIRAMMDAMGVKPPTITQQARASFHALRSALRRS